MYLADAIQRLPARAKELSMDETYGTNNADMRLFAVLAEVDGAGVPIAYLFVDVQENEEGRKEAVPGAMIGILQKFLGLLKAFG